MAATEKHLNHKQTDFEELTATVNNAVDEADSHSDREGFETESERENDREAENGPQDILLHHLQLLPYSSSQTINIGVCLFG